MILHILRRVNLSSYSLSLFSESYISSRHSSFSSPSNPHYCNSKQDERENDTVANPLAGGRLYITPSKLSTLQLSNHHFSPSSPRPSTRHSPSLTWQSPFSPRPAHRPSLSSSSHTLLLYLLPLSSSSSSSFSPRYYYC